MLRLTNKRRKEASVKRALTLENEIELIEGCRAGKDSARKELYTLYSKQMLAVCYRYTGDVDAAHDVLHDGFIKISPTSPPWRMCIEYLGDKGNGDAGDRLPAETATFQPTGGE